MPKKLPTGDEAPDRVTTDEPTQALALVEDTEQPKPTSKRRRIQRREEIPFTEEERLRVEQEIISANKDMRLVETEKATSNKTWNAEINQSRESMDEAVDVLDKGCFTVDIERIEELNYDEKMVYYYDVQSGEEVERRDMTPEELQTKMEM